MDTNLNPPFLGRQTPLYPSTQQLVRVTTSQVPGPTGFTSSSIQAASLYVAFTQQLRNKQQNLTQDDSLFPRDREPCLALDVNNFGLTPGYYLGRLAGSWQSLPVYEIGEFPVSIAGLGTVQGSSSLPTNVIPSLTQALTPAQIAVLYNLNPCQLQTFVETNAQFPISQQVVLDIPRLQYLTTILTQPQMSTLTQFLTQVQITQLTTTLTQPQLQLVTQIFNGWQLWIMMFVFTPVQIQLLLLNIPVAQLLVLIQFPMNELANLIKQPIAWLKAMLQASVVPPAPLLGNVYSPPAIPVVASTPTQAPNIAAGYASIVADTSGNLYVYANGQWNKVGGSGGGAVNTKTSGSGTTIASPGVAIVSLTNANGLHGNILLRNTAGANSLTFTVAYTDMTGNTNITSAQPLSSLTDINFDLNAAGSFAGSYAPFTTVVLTVYDTISPNHATFSWWASVVG